MSIKRHGKRAVPTITAAMEILIYLPCRLLKEASVTEGAGSQILSYILWSSRLRADRNILLTVSLTRGKLNPTVSKVHVESGSLT